MRKIKFNGVGRVGTLRPRRVWSPGEVMEVEDDVARELAGQPGFSMVRPRRSRSPGKASGEKPVDETEEKVSGS